MKISKMIYDLVEPRTRTGREGDIGYHDLMEFKPEETSGNLEIQIRTYQTHFENVYYNIIIFDYNTKKDYEVGYIYTKRNNGTIGLWDGYAIYKMIEAGNEITTEIFEKYA